MCAMGNIISKSCVKGNVLNLEEKCENCEFLLLEETSELVDKSLSGRKTPWKQHKRATELLSESFERIKKNNKSELVKNCGTQLEFVECSKGHYKKLKRANFCRVRMCPMCGWRRSLKIAHQVKQIAYDAMKNTDLCWLFLTLTMKNVIADKLSNEIDCYIKGFGKLSRRKRFKNSVLGFFRSLEVTYNKEENTYHPHYHVLLAVSSRYFDGRNYIRKDE
jgi:plasmid rolling circle replication initiator protein Rep